MTQSINQPVAFANMQSIPSLLEGRVRDYRIDSMESLGSGRPEFHQYGWVSYKHKIDLENEGEILIEKHQYHVEITCVPTQGMPKLFKLIVEALRDAGLSVGAYVYTKQTGHIKVTI